MNREEIRLGKRSYLPAAVRRRVRMQAQHRCGYCLASQRFYSSRFSIEHIIPLSRGGTSDENNLWLSCPACNWHKGSKTHEHDPVTQKRVPLFNPRQQIWSEHFAWSLNGVQAVGKTSIGRATIIALKMNDELAVVARRLWVAAKEFPPQ